MVAKWFTSLSIRFYSSLPAFLAIATVSALALIVYHKQMTHAVSLWATYALLWSGWLSFVCCTYFPYATSSLRAPITDTIDSASLSLSPYARSHPIMRQIIDFNFAAYFVVLMISTLYWIHGA